MQRRQGARIAAEALAARRDALIREGAGGLLSWP